MLGSLHFDKGNELGKKSGDDVVSIIPKLLRSCVVKACFEWFYLWAKTTPK